MWAQLSMGQVALEVHQLWRDENILGTNFLVA
jgi:hypothetical protein